MKLHEIDITKPDKELDVCALMNDGEWVEGVVFDKTGKTAKPSSGDRSGTDTLDQLVEKILRHLFGANYTDEVGSRRKLKKVIKDAVGDPDMAEEMTQDLSEGLDLLESLFFEMDNLLQVHPELTSMKLVDILEETGEYLEQWSMGMALDIVNITDKKGD